MEKDKEFDSGAKVVLKGYDILMIVRYQTAYEVWCEWFDNNFHIQGHGFKPEQLVEI